jgi:hypothetical protein
LHFIVSLDILCALAWKVMGFIVSGIKYVMPRSRSRQDSGVP